MGNCCGGRQVSKDEVQLTSSGYGKDRRTLQQQAKTWSATGVISLRDSALRVIPDEVYEIGSRARILDVSNNRLDNVPATVQDLSGLERLVAPKNSIIVIQANLALLPRLKLLDLEGNALRELPASLGGCSALETLRLSDNALATLPPELGNLPRLRALHVGQNGLEALPDAIGSLSTLETLDVSDNRLHGLPLSLGQCAALRAVQLNGNSGLCAVPAEVLLGCTLLHTLDLHGTQVTREDLQATKGYPAFEGRRRAKFSKAIEGNAMLARDGVDEGVDVVLRT